ncbi:MAG TPA: TrmH family RNA methyltransferase [Anaerolineaceae bacterium]|nr:TrmH family RNA methyltransferase [Anaerolineaceae bacterium]
MPPKSDWVFTECSNPACRLRFPLDLAEYSGKYCPKCGAELEVTEKRLSQNTDIPASLIQGQDHQIIGLLDNVRSALNVGAIFRSADGAGLVKLYLCGITPTPEEQETVARTALGSEKRLPWQQANNAIEIAKELQAMGHKLIVLEAEEGAPDLFTWQIPPDWQTLVLAVGNEITGIDPGLLRLANMTLRLPMAGIKGSLNVASAFSIAAYQLQFG